MPKEGTMLKFKNYLNSEKVPFIVYTDFECFIKPIHSCTQEKNNDDGKSYTNKYQKHEPSSFCYYIKCFDDEVYPPVTRPYTGEDSAQKFVKMLEQDIRKNFKIPPKKMIFTDEDMRDFNEATTCWICNEEFNDIPNENGYKRNEKVRDHCHFTGRYRGAAHNICNLTYRKPKFTPKVFHNLSGYDSHLL